MPSRILYFRGAILEAVEDFAPEDLLEAARAASSKYPDLTAEIWQRGRKSAVIRPCWHSRVRHMPLDDREPVAKALDVRGKADERLRSALPR